MDLDNIYIYLIVGVFCVWLIVSELDFLKIEPSDEDDEFTYEKNRISSITILISSTIVLMILLWLIYNEL